MKKYLPRNTRAASRPGSDRLTLLKYRYIFAIVGIMVFTLSMPAAASGTAGNAGDGFDAGQTVYYFYVTGCTSCIDAENTLNRLASNAAYNITVIKSNIAEASGQALLEKYFAVFEVPESAQIVPIAFTGDMFFSGKNAIVNDLGRALASGNLPPTPELRDDTAGQELLQRFSGYRLLGTLLIGLLNGINPCALTALILFMSLLMAKTDRLLTAGLTYCTGKFLTYLLLGTVAFSLLSSTALLLAGRYIRVALSVLLLLVALFYLLDAISAISQKYERIRMQLPQGLRLAIKNVTEKAAARLNTKNMIIIVLLVAIVTSLLEFLCTGQIYLTTIIYAVRSGSDYAVSAVYYLIVYCIGFIIPFLIVTLLLSNGRHIFETSQFIRRFLPVIKIMAALVFIAFSAVNLFL